MPIKSEIIGHAVPLLINDIDTDVIIPQTELITISKRDLGKGLFARWRYAENYIPKVDFILNQPKYKLANILLAGRNFGCGSSREHAVWSLLDYGIKCVIAPSYGDIFYNNSYKNRLLLIRLNENDIMEIVNTLETDNETSKQMIINIEDEIISIGGYQKKFLLDKIVKLFFITEMDEIKETLSLSNKMDAYFLKDRLARPWVYRLNF